MAPTILHIDASANTTNSATRAASAARVAALDPARVIRRDLAVETLPQITDAWIKARLVPAADQTDADRAILALSDQLIAEIEAADILVIGLPLYNFAVPAALKAWIDLVARPKRTFRYTENGAEGLLTGKSAHVLMASGGVPLGAPADFASPYIKMFLGFIGITDVTIETAAKQASS